LIHKNGYTNWQNKISIAVGRILIIEVWLFSIKVKPGFY